MILSHMFEKNRMEKKVSLARKKKECNGKSLAGAKKKKRKNGIEKSLAGEKKSGSDKNLFSSVQ